MPTVTGKGRQLHGGAWVIIYILQRQYDGRDGGAWGEKYRKYSSLWFAFQMVYNSPNSARMKPRTKKLILVPHMGLQGPKHLGDPELPFCVPWQEAESERNQQWNQD